MIKMSLGHHTEETYLFLKEVIYEMCCRGQVRVDKIKKGDGVGKLRTYAEGRNKMRKVTWN